MDVDPIDFLPGCDSYYRINSSRYSSCYSVCTHLLVMILSFGICIATLYYYEKYYVTKAFSYVSNRSILESPSENKSIQNLMKDMKNLNESFHQINLWKRKMDEYLKEYSQKDTYFEKKIKEAIDTYDCDKIGMYDYASIYAGGSIVSTPDTKPFPANKTITFFKLFEFKLLSNPEAILQPSNLPGNCFAFHGSSGRILIKLGKKIKIHSVTLEHSLYTDDCGSAPKDFKVYGRNNSYEQRGMLLGQFSYNLKGRSYQTFLINQNSSSGSLKYVELKILSNHGNDYTCIYRFRIHSNEMIKCRCENCENN